jgi:hypothetical protein
MEFSDAINSVTFNKNNLIKMTTLSLSDGSKIEAYIGVKDLTVRRPWIILKCGVFCDITTTLSINNFIINFFFIIVIKYIRYISFFLFILCLTDHICNAVRVRL